MNSRGERIMTNANLGAMPASSGNNRTYKEGATRRILVPTLRWGAILAGVAAGLSTQLLLAMLGLASGLSLTQLSEGVAPGSGTLLWSVLSLLVAAVVGSYVAGRVSGLSRKTDGLLHGLVTWSVSTLLFVLMATSLGGTLISGIFYDVGQGTATSNQVTSSIGFVGMLNRQIGSNLSPQDFRVLQDDILTGKRDTAISLLTTRSGLRTDKAAAIVDQALILSGKSLLASSEARANAEQSIKSASLVAWSVFLATALSLIASIFGGLFGATTSTRVTWEDNSAIVKPAF
jgi:hypothetical protein